MRMKLIISIMATAIMMTGCAVPGSKISGPTNLPPKPSADNLHKYVAELRGINPRVSDPNALIARNVCADNHTDGREGNRGRQDEHAKILWGADGIGQAHKMVDLANKYVCK